MLTREQIYTLIAIRNRPGSVFNPQGVGYKLPLDIIKKIANLGLNDDHDSEIACLLRCITYGNFAAAKEMLDKNPALIGKASHAYTPAGLRVRYIKPYECALGAGDPEMAEMVASYFEQFTDGAEEKAVQDAKYRQDIDKMLSEKPYDFSWIVEVIKNAPAENVTAELRVKGRQDNALSIAMETFRKQYSTEYTTSGRMHFRYVDLLEVIRAMNHEWENLKNAGEKFDKPQLFYRQVVGYVMRNLPAVDRMAFAQGLNSLLVRKEEFARFFQLRLDNISYPMTITERLPDRLGMEYYVGWWEGECISNSWWPAEGEICRTYLEQKHQKLKSLQEVKEPSCQLRK